MRTSVSRLFIALAVLASGLSAAAATQPGPGSLSGNVTAQSPPHNPIPSATVEVINPITGLPVANTGTDVDGGYFVEVENNDNDPNTSAPETYHVRVTPQPASGFTSTTVFNVVVSGATTLNVELAEATPVTWGGTIKDFAGNGIPGQLVQLIPAGAESGLSTTTNGSGNYSFNVLTGQYFLLVNGDNQSDTKQAPQFYALLTATFDITADATVDFTLPLRRVTVQVREGTMT